MAHLYRLHGACSLEVPGSNPGRAGYLSSWLCRYSAPNCSKACSVYSATYATVYYKEPLNTFEIRVGHSSNQFFSTAGISDHLAVISETDCCKTKWNKEKISFRKINKIYYESFHSDILNLDLIKKPEKDLSALFQQKTQTPWMTPEIMKAKTLRHNLERACHRSRTHLDRSRYKHQCHLCNRMMTKAK